MCAELTFARGANDGISHPKCAAALRLQAYARENTPLAPPERAPVCDNRFIGLENKQQQGEAQFRAKCEKEKASAACSSRRSRAGLSCLCTGWDPDEHVSTETVCKKQKKEGDDEETGGEKDQEI